MYDAERGAIGLTRYPNSHFVTGLAVLCSIGLHAWGQSPSLLLDEDNPRTARASSILPDEVSRARNVQVNPAAMPTPNTAVGDTLRLNLFKDVDVECYFEDLKVHRNNGYTWVGRLVDDPYSSVTISVVDGVMAANIHSPIHGEYQVRYIGQVDYESREIDPMMFPPCGTGPEHAVPPAPVTGKLRRAQPDAKTATYVVDVLVVYTASARAAVGGTAAMQSLINLAITESNDAYLYSIVDMELNLAGTFEVNYNESSGFSPALSALTSTNDGVMDEVHVAREAFGADMVSLIIDNSGSCGLAYLMTSLAGDFSGSAFSVEHYSCATGNYSFAHELGHNMGSHHDLENAPGGGLYPYSLGWHWGNSSNPGYNGDYRSIMAYAPGTRVQRFSNPNVQFAGEATGSAGVADNALSLNNAASTVAAWRDPAAWIAVAPNNGLTVNGSVGGPFTPSSLGFTLTNLDNASANWTASSNQAWATVAPGSGTISAASSTGASVDIGAGANALPAGSHTATITFADTSNSKVFAYNVRLTAIGQPANAQYWYSMDSDPGWTGTGGWQYGVPTGGGTNNPDPTSGVTGSNVYGYNLSGDYTDNMPEQTLTTTAIDCSNLANVQLNFWRWLGVESSAYDHAKVQVSNNGSSWTNVWVHSGASISESAWSNHVYDISSVADGQATVYIRWVMGTTDSSVTYSGWNIDDVAIVGDNVGPSPSDDVWIDFGYAGTELGTQIQPFNTIAEGLPYLNSGGTLHLAAGNTSETVTLNTPMTLQAEGGAVRIGASAR